MSGYSGPIVDTDVHQAYKRPSDVIAYLPERWKEYLGSRPEAARLMSSPGGAHPLGVDGQLADSYPADGGGAGSDYPLMRQQLLDKYPMYRVILNRLGGFGTHPNQQLGVALCSAVNQWNIDHWLGFGDERIYSVLELPWAVPEEAAKEVRRLGGHPHICGAFFAGNPIGRPIGDPIFHPILEAIADMGLVLVLHVTANERPTHHVRSIGEKIGPSDLWPYSGHQATHYISSLIVNGVFEKWPSLKVLFNEYGVGWLPTSVWRLDSVYDLLRLESDWVRRRPSEYIHEHIRFGTQPLDESRDDKSAIGELLSALDGADDLLCFSTDYPHYTFDEPVAMQRLIPAAWHRKVFCDNACDFFGWERPATAPTPEPVPSLTR